MKNHTNRDLSHHENIILFVINSYFQFRQIFSTIFQNFERMFDIDTNSK